MTHRSVIVCALSIAFGFAALLSEAKVPYHFFQDSVRRDADTVESDQVVRLDNGCTGYFVENTAGKVYVGSARHCVSFSATAWCKNGGTFDDNSGGKGKCVKLLVGDVNHDIVFFEADFPYTPRQTLRLAGFAVEGTPLRMIGFPCDKFRECKLTVTENCQLLKTGMRSPHSSRSMSDRSGLHDCTTYGGNSGGPMIAEGTATVVGLPFTYHPGDYTPSPSGDVREAAYIALMPSFVHANRRALERAHVAIDD